MFLRELACDDAADGRAFKPREAGQELMWDVAVLGRALRQSVARWTVRSCSIARGVEDGIPYARYVEVR